MFSILTILIFSRATTATDVSGTISTDITWTLANSPYVVIGNVLVNSGVTLTIEPGVTVKFNSGMALQIDGALIAQATNANQITFTSNQSTPAADDWGYILFSDSSVDAIYDLNGNYTGGSILEHALVQYGGDITSDHRGAVLLNVAHPFINHTMVSDNSASGVHGWNVAGKIKLTNNTIKNNVATGPIWGDGGGIFIDSTSPACIVEISHNIIRQNRSDNRGAGISINWCQSGTTSHNLIINNSISTSIRIR